MNKKYLNFYLSLLLLLFCGTARAQSNSTCFNQCPQLLTESEKICFKNGWPHSTSPDGTSTWEICLEGTFDDGSGGETCPPFSFQCCFTVAANQLCNCIVIPTRAGKTINQTYTNLNIKVKRNGAIAFNGSFSSFLAGTSGSGISSESAKAFIGSTGAISSCDGAGNYIFYGTGTS